MSFDNEQENGLPDRNAVFESSPYDDTVVTTTNSNYDMDDKVTTNRKIEVVLNENSIYETNNMIKSDTEVSLVGLKYDNYTYATKEKKLCFIGNDFEDIPTEIIYQFGLKTQILDVSFNNLSNLNDLCQFPNLDELIIDNNLVSEITDFPSLPRLKLLSCNKNKIKDIHVFIDKVKTFFPSLTYLSLLGNEACPNQLIDPSKDEYDYSRYRKYVIFRLPKLRFLDCYEITEKEREEASKESLFYDVVSYKDDVDSSNNSTKDRNDEDANDKYTPLTDNYVDKNNNDSNPKGTFGFVKYVYYGKQSEGNRFIRNDDL